MVRAATIRKLIGTAVLLSLVVATVLGFYQSSPDLHAFFRQDIGLSEDQIVDIRSGKAVAKAMPSRTPAEVLLFGAIYIHASPESYLRFAHDFDRLRKVPNYLALGVFSDPPQPSDLQGFSFDDDDIKGLKNCKPGNCLIQMPANSIEELQRSVDWSAADVNQRVNQLLQQTALQRLLAYQREGNRVLGVYNDKRDPTDVPQQYCHIQGVDCLLRLAGPGGATPTLVQGLK